jgi:hypothetical protein
LAVVMSQKQEARIFYQCYYVLYLYKDHVGNKGCTLEFNRVSTRFTSDGGEQKLARATQFLARERL